MQKAPAPMGYPAPPPEPIQQAQPQGEVADWQRADFESPKDDGIQDQLAYTDHPANEIPSPEQMAALDTSFASDDITLNRQVLELGSAASEFRPKSRGIIGGLAHLATVPATVLPQAATKPAEAKKAKISMLTNSFKTSEELQLEKEPIRVRETGFWFWRRIIVPPNAYVVQTRMGRKDPVTIGLGLSFRYDPNRDAYLVVPAAMQTIGIIANCISKEKQGINVLAYVQWQIADFSIAYRKLDFSDSRDPLGIVNAQLREQAEAAIKDKIATMSVEEVLTDKEPIIEELTTRLKTVAEGRAQNSQPATATRSAAQAPGTNGVADEGLGIKIVTVQIKEAFVSSQTLWENLQAPFRHEKDKAARISLLLAQDEIRKKELETRQIAETSEAETLVAIERIKQTKQTEAFQVKTTEEATRLIAEQEEARKRIALEEQTTITRRESEQKLQLQAAQAQQEAKLAALRRAQEEALERSRLDTESIARQKALQVEQVLREIAEETRLADAKLEADRQSVERDTERRKLQSDLALAIQAQTDQLENSRQEADLNRKRQERVTALELEEAANRVQLSLAEQRANIYRIEQEVRNSISSGDISSRLVEKLPELAMHMPEIHELKVLQTGGTDGAFDSLTSFLARLMAIADNLGIRLNGLNGQNGDKSPGELNGSDD